MSFFTDLPQRDSVAIRDGDGRRVLLQPHQRRWSALLVLGLLCGGLFFYGINMGELYRTENLRAIIGAEFLRSGNWIVPRLYGEPLLTKPPGMYAAIAAASWPWGQVTEWTARLPSALAATAIVFLIYWYVSRQVGRLGGLVAAAVTPCTFLWLDKAAAAEIDMLQVASVSAALLFFFRAVETDSVSPCHPVTVSPRHQVWWLLALLCVAGGVLTKWTAPVFFYAAAIPFLLWRRQLRLLFSPAHLISAFIGAAICFAWVGAVLYQVGWDVFYETVKQEALPRVSHRHNLHENLWLETVLHPLALLAVNLPWSGFALLTLLPAFHRLWDERGQRLLQGFHCWVWPNIVVWTILPAHDTRHSFPLFPGITGLAGMVWLAFITGRLPAWQTRLHVGYALFGLSVFGLLMMTGAALGLWLLPSTHWWLVLLVAGMALWCVVEGFRAWRADRPGWLLASVVLTWVVLKVAFVQLYVPMRDGEVPVRKVEVTRAGKEVPLFRQQPRSPRARGQLLARTVPSEQPLYLYRVKDEGLMFYYARPVVQLHRWQDLPLGHEPVYCVITADHWRKLQQRTDRQLVVEVPLTDKDGEPIALVGIVEVEPPIMRAEIRNP